MRRPLIKQLIAEFQEYTPDLPKGFEEWARSEIRKRNHMMFYKKDRKNTVAICSACGSVQNPKKIGHNEEITCSKCRKKTMAKSINKATRYTVRDFLTVAQKFKSKDETGIIVRYFALTMKYKESKEETKGFPEVIPDKLTNPVFEKLWEASRTYIVMNKRTGKWVIFDAEKETKLEYIKGGNPQYKVIPYWAIERKRSSMFNKELLRTKDCITYKRNLKGIQGEEFKYSGITHFKPERFNIADYLWTYRTFPELEMLSKLGYYKIAQDLVDKHMYWGSGYWEAGIVEKLKSLDKETAKTIKEKNFGKSELELLLEMRKESSASAEEAAWVAENITTNKDRLFEIMKHAPISKIIRYVEKQGEDKGHTVITWADYLEQCKILNLNLEDEYHLYPKNLEARHTTYSAQIKARKSAVMSKKIREQHKKWAPVMNWKYKDYEFVVARTGAQLVYEGKALNHCVGGGSYHERIAKERSLIILVRKNGKPECTIEWSLLHMKIAQSRAMHNTKPKKGTENAIESWVKYVEKQMKKKPEAIKEAI